MRVSGRIASGEPGHVVNTSSVSGLPAGPHGIYGVTKHAVTRQSEIAWYDRRRPGAPVGISVGISVLCPGIVATRINSAERHRPPHLRDEVDESLAAGRRTRLQAAEDGFCVRACHRLRWPRQSCRV
jgi:NAD(P)-dependent dehydrogenase (short-subunit alcohol dehydrogenase family)